MLHVKDGLFSMVRRYTPWGNFGVDGDGQPRSKVRIP